MKKITSDQNKKLSRIYVAKIKHYFDKWKIASFSVVNEEIRGNKKMVLNSFVSIVDKLSKRQKQSAFTSILTYSKANPDNISKILIKYFKILGRQRQKEKLGNRVK